jgi:hypothetical protein
MSTLNIHFLLDETGSMEMVKQATIDGFNEYVRTLWARKEQDSLFSFATFDSERFTRRCESVKLDDVPELTAESYNPGSMTNLYDAVARTIRAADGQSNVLVVIMTDGQENSSKEFSQRQINDMITERRSSKGWEFAFLGANQDAWATGRMLGVAQASSISYAGTAKGTMSAMRAASGATLAYAVAPDTHRAAFFAGKRHVDDDADDSDDTTADKTTGNG